MKDLTEEERKQLFQAIPGFDAGFLEVIPVDRYHSKQYILDLTVENIAGILRSWKGKSRKIIMTDMMDRVILETEGDNIIQCAKPKLKEQVLSLLSAAEAGEAVLPEQIPMAPKSLWDRSLAMEARLEKEIELQMLLEEEYGSIGF